MCDAWYENMDNSELNGVVFVDIRKAFDSINHGILLHKMRDEFGISNIELKLFESYLSRGVVPPLTFKVMRKSALFKRKVPFLHG